MRAGTIVASNYLEMARLLAESFLDHHPGDTFVILVVDDLPVGELGGAEADGDDGREFEIARLADLDLTAGELDRMKTIYDVMELSTAVKPSFLQLLLAGDELAVYLDPDIYVYGAFGELIEPARSAGIVLTPHVLDPIPRDGTAPNERMIMSSGIFNLGFIGVGRSADNFLHWWQERLLIDAVSDVEANLFTDQRWIDWVPATFGAEICREPGMNVAWWNIHERTLDVDPVGAAAAGRHGEMTEGVVTANARPLRFVHFSGYDPSLPDRLSKHQENPRTPHAEGSVIRLLADRYGAALDANGHYERRRTPYQWNSSETGADLSPTVRGICRSALLKGHRTGTEAGELDTSVPMAFGPSAVHFEEWLRDGVAGTADVRISRLELALYESRADLRTAFPNPDGVDAPALRAWLDNDPGAREALGDRWVEPAAEPVAPADSNSVNSPIHKRAIDRAKREVAPRLRRIRSKVGL